MQDGDSPDFVRGDPRDGTRTGQPAAGECGTTDTAAGCREGVCGGEPIIDGLRVTVRHVATLHRRGESIIEIAESLGITEAQVREILERPGLAGRPPGQREIHLLGSLLVPSDGMVIFLFEGASSSAIREAASLTLYASHNESAAQTAAGFESNTYGAAARIRF